MNLLGQIEDLLLSLPGVLLAISLHELCHAYAAYRLGDPTAKFMGRISLNPLRHFDLFGFIALLFFRIGWAKPVSVDARFLKNPKRDMAIISLAGPLSNFLLALLSSFLFMILFRVGIEFGVLSNSVYYSACIVVRYMILTNLGLGVFNLIPVPPLDGSKILYSFLPYHLVYKIQSVERYLYLALILLVLTGVLSGPIHIAVNFLEEAFLNLAEGVVF